jgi:hypothetical protein
VVSSVLYNIMDLNKHFIVTLHRNVGREEGWLAWGGTFKEKKLWDAQ